MRPSNNWLRGMGGALLSPIFLGVVPILAKLAYAGQIDVMTVVAARTLLAAALLWGATAVFGRHFIASSTPAILSSFLAGAINGVGSIFFYISLTRIDASLGQLINISYLIFVTLFLRLIGQNISRLTLLRVGLAIGAIYLLTWGGLGAPDWVGVGLMLVAAVSYAIQLVLSQRILVDIPAPTMTLYAMTAMAVVTTAAWFLFPPAELVWTTAGLQAVIWMGVATALSRLTLFIGVKHLGSIQTALLGVSEVLVTIIIAILLLNEYLTPAQWLGGGVLLFSVLLVQFERNVPRFVDWWRIFWRP
jgi:drug/metabolite transporter (DMT)-like permease